MQNPFTASASAVLPVGSWAWLAVKKGSLYWPKEPGHSEPGQWTQLVHEGGEPGRFELVLFETSAEASRGILAWLAEGKQTSSFPGMDLGRLIVELDRLELVLASESFSAVP